jgi:sigma-54 specific flagellar transcriptional regulator A
VSIRPAINWALEGPSEALTHQPGSPLERVLKLARRLASAGAPLLIAGEDGSGRESLARHVHALSSRAAKSFVPLDCAVLPGPILETELFGREADAYGPFREGRLHQAEGGTLYLEEIEALQPPMQLKVLRLIDEGSYEPAGGAPRGLDVRVIAATGADLPARVEAGLFRRDLYYALCAQTLSMPPLRERPGDVRAIFEKLWRRREAEREVGAEVILELCAHEWPGNLREMENLVERLSVCTDAQRLTVDTLPPGGLFRAYPKPKPREGEGPPPAELYEPKPSAPSDGRIAFPVDLQAVLKAVEDRYVDAALVASKGSKKTAAELLGLHRTTLVEKLRRRHPSTESSTESEKA